MCSGLLYSPDNETNMKAIVLLLRTSDLVLVLYMPHSFLSSSALLQRNT